MYNVIGFCMCNTIIIYKQQSLTEYGVIHFNEIRNSKFGGKKKTIDVLRRVAE